MTYFAAIDLGASFVKSALVDIEGATIRDISRTSFPPFVRNRAPGVREVDLPQVADRFFGALDRLLQLEPRCEGVLISTQMHGFVLMNREGTPASDFISWQDTRSLGHVPDQSSSFEAFEARIPDRARIGNEVGPGHAASVLFSMSRDGMVLDDVIPVPLPVALLMERLGAAPTADETLAASFGAWDVHRSKWDQALIDALGLGLIQWPRVTVWNEIVAEIEHAGRSIPIYSPVGDQQAALLGSFLSPAELSINIGTGSQVSILSGEPIPGQFKVRPHLGNGFIATVTHIPAGRALNVLASLFARQGESLNETWEEIGRAVEGVTETDLSIDLAFFPSAFGDRGRMENISETNLALGHMFLAAYENMANNYRKAALQLRSDKEDWGSLVLSGGMAHRNDRLRRIISQRLERRYRLSSSPDETLTGLSVLAQLISGHASSFFEASEKCRRAGLNGAC